MASRRNQRSVKNVSAATRANAHKLGRPIGTWSTTPSRMPHTTLCWSSVMCASQISRTSVQGSSWIHLVTGAAS
jgi:hypothetical protein